MSEAERSKINLMAPAKWEELRARLRAFCASAPSITLRIHEDPEELILERVHDGFVPKRLRLEYDSLVPRITWSCCDPMEHRGEIRFRQVNGSVIYLVNNKVSFIDEIVVALTSCVTGSV